MKLRFLVVSVCVALGFGFASAQTSTVKGVLRDATTGEPLLFANVQLEGTTQGTSTNAAGEFTLAVPDGDYALRCSYVGYKTVVFPVHVTGRTSITLSLQSVDMLLQDVTVYARQDRGAAEAAGASALTLQSERITEVTAAVPDVLRSIQMLPGVSSNNEFSARYNVRGGNQDENLVLVNGTKVYEPFHLKEASNASVGIFNVDLIRKMDLMTGGFPARYGDRMSSVLNIEYREGDREAYHGGATLSLTNLDAHAEGPLGENASFIVAARKSYLEYVMQFLDFAPEVHPSFYDVQGVIGYSPAPGTKLMLKLIHSGDNFVEDPHGNLAGPFSWTNRDARGRTVYNTNSQTDSTDKHADYYSNVAALEAVTVLSGSAVLKTELSLYDQRDAEHSLNRNAYSYRGTGPAAYFYDSNSDHIFENALHIRTLEVSSSLDFQLLPFYGIKAGGSYQRITYDQDRVDQRVIREYTNVRNFPDTTDSRRVESSLDNVSDRIHTTSFKTAGYLENVLQLSEGLLVNLGGRADYFGLNRDLTWSPRLCVSYRVPVGLTLRGSWGKYYQSPVYAQIASPVASDTNTLSQQSTQVVLGADYEIPLNGGRTHFLQVKVEAFHKTYANLVDATVSSDGIVHYSRRNDAEGRAEGIDIYAVCSTPLIYGWISYGLLKAEQRILGTQLWYPRYTDQRHTLAVLGEVNCGAGWTANMRYTYGSGYAYTPSTAVFDPVKSVWNWAAGAPNSDHMPAYSRLDARVTKSLRLFGASASAYLDVSNLLNTVNVQAYQYTFDTQGSPRIEDIKLWPIIPSLGLTVSI